MTYLKLKTRPYSNHFNDAFQNLLTPFAGLDANTLRPLGTIPVNIYDGVSAYEIEVAAPGLAREDFKLSVENNLLTVSAEVAERETADRKNTRQEFKPAAFKRSFTLDEQVDTENITAQYSAGILRITLQKKPNVTPAPKNIAVQ